MVDIISIKNKIKDIQFLSEFCAEVKKDKNKKIVLCHGDFDVLHSGHLNYLLEAKKNGDYLIVSVTGKNFINKGPN
jgi:bifunctional ADP-heptose synthase (sugar kinase/adenylyltransferase)